MKRLYQPAECEVADLSACDLLTLSAVSGTADGDDDSFDPGIIG